MELLQKHLVVAVQSPTPDTLRPYGCHPQTGRLRRRKFVGEATSMYKSYTQDFSELSLARVLF
jgi:hypothetical protein